jgi:uncharacterized membrane protein
MASVAARAPKPATRFDRIVTDRVLAGGAVVMLAFVITAVARGHAQWAHIPWPVWVHLATMGTALVLTPVMLLRAKGTRSHRVLGWTWAAAMLATAGFSLLIRASNNGGFSVIHILSVWVAVQVPWIVYRARAHNVAGHHRSVRGLVIGALLVAGFFTFPFDRLLGHWLFS